MPHAFIVRAADWKVDEIAIAEVRRAVFIVEQGVPEALEWESGDAKCLWFLAVSAEPAVIGIVRLTRAGRIGRMAVVPAWRRRGVGRALLAVAVQAAAKTGLKQVHLSAQTHAIAFYARHGFIVDGQVYQDAGIPHRSMFFDLNERETKS